MGSRSPGQRAVASDGIDAQEVDSQKNRDYSLGLGPDVANK